MAESSGAGNIPAQLINFGILILTRATILVSNIRRWYARPDSEKTRPNFKMHFKNVQKVINKIQPITNVESLG